MTSIRKTIKSAKKAWNADKITLHISFKSGERIKFTPAMRHNIRECNAKFLGFYYNNYRAKHKINMHKNKITGS
jgi:hypothetical protein